jgi:hypothetical protein
MYAGAAAPAFHAHLKMLSLNRFLCFNTLFCAVREWSGDRGAAKPPCASFLKIRRASSPGPSVCFLVAKKKGRGERGGGVPTLVTLLSSPTTTIASMLPPNTRLLLPPFHGFSFSGLPDTFWVPPFGTQTTGKTPGRGFRHDA